MTASGIAFKVTYNDGGAACEGGVGYRGLCSDATMLLNVRKRRMTNCVADRCARYVKRGLRPEERPREPRRVEDAWCYEAFLLRRRPWRFSAGIFHRGDRQGEAIPFAGGASGNVVFLTTRFPDQDESQRSVFAVYRVGEKVTTESGHELVSDGSMELLLPDELAKRVRYWDYADAPNGPDWRTGLFRYVSESATDRLLAEVAFVLADRDERDVLVRALGPTFQPRPPRSSGALPLLPLGEGDAHRSLKDRVAANPPLIGLPASAKAFVEFGFPSGDRVDIAFELEDGRRVVVEIETLFAEPGAYQAIKYRALMEAVLGEPLGSGRVEAVLVANAFAPSTRALASRYGVRLVELAAGIH